MSFIFNAIIFFATVACITTNGGAFFRNYVVHVSYNDHIFWIFSPALIFISCFYVTYDSFHFYFHLIFLMYKYIFHQSTFIDFLFPGLCIYAFTCTFIREKPRSKPQKKEKKNDSKLCFFRGFILIILVSRLLFH